MKKRQSSPQRESVHVFSRDATSLLRGGSTPVPIPIVPILSPGIPPGNDPPDTGGGAGGG